MDVSIRKVPGLTPIAAKENSSGKICAWVLGCFEQDVCPSNPNCTASLGYCGTSDVHVEHTCFHLNTRLQKFQLIKAFSGNCEFHFELTIDNHQPEFHNGPRQQKNTNYIPLWWLQAISGQCLTYAVVLRREGCWWYMYACYDIMLDFEHYGTDVKADSRYLFSSLLALTATWFWHFFSVYGLHGS